MKKIIAALLMAIFVFAFAACGTDKQGSPVGNKGSDAQADTKIAVEDEAAAENEAGSADEDAPADSINIANLSEETVEMTEKLQQVSYADGEEQVNPFYKKGTNEENMACYVVHFAGQDAETNIPMDNTVIYSTDEGESYIEKVSFSYEIEGETMAVEQYRLYINTAQE